MTTQKDETTASTTTTQSTTTTTASNPSGCNSLGTTLVQSDGSIRMLDSSRAEWCAFKKYSSYRVNDEIWFKPCDVSNANPNKAGKYRFSFDSSTGLVSSAGALDFMQLNLCWRISSLTRYGKQRVLLSTCNANDANQVFQVINGRLHLQGETRICLGFEEHRVNAVTGIAMTVQDCYPSVFGSNAGCANQALVDADQAIYPTGLTDKCVFKRYSGYQAQDEIWIDTCSAGHQNPNKAGKYHWSYDAATGLISSVGALSYQDGIAYCMKINNKNRFYKQRVKLARCNANDELQQMDYLNGRIYSRANSRLCAGYEYNKLAADGKLRLSFQHVIQMILLLILLILERRGKHLDLKFQVSTVSIQTHRQQLLKLKLLQLKLQPPSQLPKLPAQQLLQPPQPNLPLPLLKLPQQLKVKLPPFSVT